MTTNNNNPNPLYPAGSTYTLEEFIPVVRAAQKMGLVGSAELTPWLNDTQGDCSYILDITAEPYTLLQDIQAPYDAPKPLTVEEIKAAKKVWYLDPEDGYTQVISSWYVKAQAIAYGMPCYATEDDCKRAHGLEVA